MSFSVWEEVESDTTAVLDTKLCKLSRFLLKFMICKEKLSKSLHRLIENGWTSSDLEVQHKRILMCCDGLCI